MKKKSNKTAREASGEILTAKLPFVYTEAYKALRTNVEFLVSSNDAKKIAVTSALSGEGKTCVSINLAISLAQTGKKVLLLDCDLRKPKIHRYLRIKHSSQFGVSTVLGGTAELDSAIGYLEDLGLYVMLAGPTPPNPSELLNSARCEDMFAKLTDKFDYIICDTAPVAIVTDAVALSKYCDGTIFVIRQNHSTIEQVQLAVSRLENVNTKIYGAVLNGYDTKFDATSGYSRGKYNYSYSNKHYADGEE